MGQFIRELTEWTGNIPNDCYIPISFSGETYKITQNLLESGLSIQNSGTLSGLNDVFTNSSLSGDSLMYNGIAWLGTTINISGYIPIELQYVNVPMTGTMTLSSTAFIPIISGQLTISSNTSKIHILANLSLHGKGNSTVGFFRMVEYNITSGAGQNAFVGSGSGFRSPISSSAVIEEFSTVLTPMFLQGIGHHNGQAGDEINYILYGRLPDATLKEIHINKLNVDSDSSSITRGFSSLIIRELI